MCEYLALILRNTSATELSGSGQTRDTAGATLPQVPIPEVNMLTTLVVILLVLWLLGMGTAYTAGGLIHILLVIAIIVVLLRVIQGRNPFRG